MRSARRKRCLNDLTAGSPSGFDCLYQIAISSQQNDHVVRSISGCLGNAHRKPGIDPLLLIGNKWRIALRTHINLFAAIGAPCRIPLLLLVHEHPHLPLAAQESINPVLVSERAWIVWIV